MLKDEIIQIRTDSATKERLQRAAHIHGGPQAPLGGFLLELGLQASLDLEKKNLEISRRSGISDPLIEKNILYALVENALEQGANDIHIIANEDDDNYPQRMSRVLYSIDGYFVKQPLITTKEHLRISDDLQQSKTVILSPGSVDGEIFYKSSRLRFVILKTLNGPNVIIRIIRQVDYSKIDINNDIFNPVIRCLENKKEGVIIAGLCGSGKTTFMYKVMDALSKKELNIYSVENIIEAKISGTNQFQGDDDGGSLKGLRLIERMSPDVVFIDEIRSREVSQEIQALLKYRKISVMGDMHALNPHDVLRRLELLSYNGEIPNWISLIVCVDLVKSFCKNCVIWTESTPSEQKKGWPLIIPIKGSGCEKCNETGESGRHQLQTLTRVDNTKSTIAEKLMPVISLKDAIISATKAGILNPREITYEEN